MRFGLFLNKQYLSHEPARHRFADHLEQVRLARDLGFDTIIVGQHFLSTPFQEPQPVPLLARLAAESGSMRLGISILLAALLPPVEVAETGATLDLITDGRFICGLGLGYRQEEFDAFGVPLTDRVRRFEENVALIRRLWTEDSVTHESAHCRLDGVRLSLKPLQQPHPPIWIAALSQASLRYAIRNGHHLLTTLFRDPIERVAERLRDYRQMLAEAGKSPADSQMGVLRIAHVAENDATAREVVPHVVKNHRTWHHLHFGTERVAGGIVGTDPVENEPSPEEMFERLIIGSPDRCIKQIRALQEVGVELLLLNMNFGKITHREAMRSLRLFGAEVMPAFNP